MARHSAVRGTVIKWAIVLASALAFAFNLVPEGVTSQSWRLLTIFVTTIIGSIMCLVPAAAIVLIGVTAIALFNVLLVGGALRGFADPVVWLGLAVSAPSILIRGMVGFVWWKILGLR